MAALDRRRFARHLLLAEIGEAGQARLCAARARVPASADPRAAEVGRDYLERAGVSVIDAHAQQHVSGAVELALPDAAGVRALAGAADLEHAAAALAGAFAAVEAIKAVLGMRAAELPAGLSLGGRERGADA